MLWCQITNHDKGRYVSKMSECLADVFRKVITLGAGSSSYGRENCLSHPGTEDRWLDVQNSPLLFLLFINFNLHFHLCVRLNSSLCVLLFVHKL